MTKIEIESIVRFCCKELNLPLPKIKILKEGFGVGSCSFENGICTVAFIPDRMNKDKAWQDESIWKFMKYTPRLQWEYSFFIVAHELGHYLQYKRHWMWLATYSKEVETYLRKYKKFSLQKYNQFKIEANANKIALILLKRAKKAKFKL